MLQKPQFERGNLVFQGKTSVDCSLMMVMSKTCHCRNLSLREGNLVFQGKTIFRLQIEDGSEEKLSLQKPQFERGKPLLVSFPYVIYLIQLVVIFL